MRKVIIILNTLVKDLRCSSTCKAKTIKYLLKSDSLKISLENAKQRHNTAAGQNSEETVAWVFKTRMKLFYLLCQEKANSEYNRCYGRLLYFDPYRNQPDPHDMLNIH